jgi:hypothetical protein
MEVVSYYRKRFNLFFLKVYFFSWREESRVEHLLRSVRDYVYDCHCLRPKHHIAYKDYKLWTCHLVFIFILLWILFFLCYCACFSASPFGTFCLWSWNFEVLIITKGWFCLNNQNSDGLRASSSLLLPSFCQTQRSKRETLQLWGTISENSNYIMQRHQPLNISLRARAQDLEAKCTVVDFNGYV